MAENDGESSAAPVRSKKRRRIAIACHNCRVRKTKCNGQRPICATCSALSLECRYDASEHATNLIIPNHYVAGLENRICDVEARLQRHDDLLKEQQQRPQQQQRQVHPLPSPRPAAPDVITPDSPRLDPPQELGPDGLGIGFVDESSSTYFGESASITFTRHLARATSVVFFNEKPHRSTRNAQDGQPGVSHNLPHLPDFAKFARLGSDDASLGLPQSAEVDRLFDVYFNSTGLLFPFLHERTFWTRYREATHLDATPRAWLAILYMMLANSVCNDHQPYADSKDRLDQSRRFYYRAVTISGETMGTSITLQTVQYLFLATLYLQGTQGASRTWISHGQLVQAAFSVGLHIPGGHISEDDLATETRKRTWLSIYCLDKVLSATLGRPSLIVDEHMVLDPPAPWRLERPDIGAEQQLSGMPTDFLRVSIDLYQIMSRSLVRQYRGNYNNLGRANHESNEIQVSSGLRHELCSWASLLPPELRLLGPGDTSLLLHHSKENRLRTVLTLRYHSVNLLIHRNLIIAALQNLASSSGGSVKMSDTTRIAVFEATACLEGARTTIDIAHAIIFEKSSRNHTSNLGNWFFNLHYLFSAALVVYAYELLNHVYEISAAKRIIPDSGHAHLRKVVEAMSKLDADNPITNGCAKYIARLLEILKSAPGESSASGEDMSSTTGVASSIEDFTGLNELFDNTALWEEFFGLVEPVSFDTL